MDFRRKAWIDLFSLELKLAHRYSKGPDKGAFWESRDFLLSEKSILVVKAVAVSTRNGKE